MRVRVLTFATDTSGVGYSNWIQSAKANGVDYVVLGQGVEWGGFRTKTKMVYDYLCTLDPGFLILVVDCYDVVFNSVPGKSFSDNCVEAWSHYTDADIVMGAEYSCGGNCYKASRDTRAINQSAFKYPNGGCVIGTSEKLEKFYAAMLATTIDDDQVCIGYLRSVGEWVVELDFHQRFVLNLSSIRVTDVHYDTDKAAWASTTYPTITPLMLHTPGIRCDRGARYNKITSKLGLTPIRIDWTLGWMLQNQVQVWLPILGVIIVLITTMVIIVLVHKRKTERGVCI
jgi:hypothetical protein